MHHNLTRRQPAAPLSREAGLPSEPAREGKKIPEQHLLAIARRSQDRWRFRGPEFAFGRFYRSAGTPATAGARSASAPTPSLSTRRPILRCGIPRGTPLFALRLPLFALNLALLAQRPPFVHRQLLPVFAHLLPHLLSLFRRHGGDVFANFLSRLHFLIHGHSTPACFSLQPFRRRKAQKALRAFRSARATILLRIRCFSSQHSKRQQSRAAGTQNPVVGKRTEQGFGFHDDYFPARL